MRTKVIVLVLGVFLAAAGQTTQILDPGGIQPVALLAVDLNRDGYPDLAVACHSSNSIAIFENTRKPCASFDGAVQWTLNDSPVALAAGTFLDPVCLKEPHCFPFTAVFPNIVAVTQYQPGLVRLSPVEDKEPFLKLTPGGPISVASLPYTTLTHLVVADLDRDGANDVAVLDGISMKIGVHYGSRAALLPPIPAQGSAVRPPDKVIALEGEQAYFLGAADFDRDGILDLVVAVDGNLVFLPGNGAAAQKVKLGKKLVSFALADFNRDGYVDVAVVDPEFMALTVVYNRGCWRFERGPRFKFDGGPVAVVAGDFDRNGLVDLAVAEKEANRVTLVMSELAGQEEVKRADPANYGPAQPEQIGLVKFKLARVFEVGKSPVALAAEDFDQNGTLDLAVALFGENKVQVIYNPAECLNCAGQVICAPPKTGEKKPAGTSEGSPQGQGEAPASAPSSSAGSNLSVLEAGSFALPRNDLNLFAAGDLNGDGLVDLVLGSTTSEEILLFQGEKDGTFTAKGNVLIGLVPDKLLCADIDGNGLADVVAVSWAEAEGVVLWSSGRFLFAPSTFFGLPQGVKDVFTFRLSEAARDALVLLRDEGPLVWSILQRSGIVELQKIPSALATLKPLPQGLYTYLQLGPSAVATAHYSNNPGELSFSLYGLPLGNFQVPHEGAIRAIAVADVNRDGIQDLLGLDETGRIRIWTVRKGG